MTLALNPVVIVGRLSLGIAQVRGLDSIRTIGGAKRQVLGERGGVYAF